MIIMMIKMLSFIKILINNGGYFSLKISLNGFKFEDEIFIHSFSSKYYVFKLLIVYRNKYV